MKPNANPRPIIERRGPGAPRQPMKPKAWSHQDELREARGREAIFTFLDGDKIQAQILEADQFAIKIRGTDNQSSVTVWKHALSGYKLLG